VGDVVSFLNQTKIKRLISWSWINQDQDTKKLSQDWLSATHYLET